MKSRSMVVCIAVMCLGVDAIAAEKKESAADLSGNLVVFHAGSLSVPMKELSAAFKKEHPKVNFLMESAGSVECARKISELKKPCDVMVSADYLVIDRRLIPEHASWNIHFAVNEMTIVYRDKSRRSGEISATNWFQILLDKRVAFGRADPNSDPCGYRAVLSMKLAEKHYAVEGLAAKLLAKDTKYMRPKEVDLLALLESGSIDYIFLYRSVAEQHGLKRLILPDEVNLKSAALAGLYNSVSVQVTGKKPGEMIEQKGEPMVYGITVPKNARNPELAEAFVRFVVDEEGRKIMERNGQPVIVPAGVTGLDKLPESLEPYVRK